ncbi:MAG TPA: O-antigen ligase family protein, partial [Gaiellaceae bacterium]|nr:O-antigen ligase family protein [Gaiellaceae bacterium]
LASRRLTVRGSGFEGPLGLFLIAILGSILTNEERLRHRDSFILLGRTFVREDLAIDVLKTFVFLLSFYIVFYLTISVVRDVRAIHAVLKIIVGTGTIVAFFALIEARTNYNVFDHLAGYLPGATFEGALTDAGIGRGGRLRVYASAQHPIALAVLLVMLLPLAAYLWRYTRRAVWAGSALLILVAAVSTVSRTSITTMATVAVVFVWLRRDSVKRLWPLVLPALLAIHIAVPGAIGGIQEAFFPSHGLIQDQTQFGGRVSPSRLRPQFHTIGAHPLFGEGYGTRITEATLRQNAIVLDDQWLDTAVETGLVGFFAWIWFFARFIRRAGREAKRDRSSRGWLLTALTSSIAAFAVGMLTYDAFSFIQVTFIMFILAALGACTLKAAGPWGPESDRPPTVVRVPAARFRNPAREPA